VRFGMTREQTASDRSDMRKRNTSTRKALTLVLMTVAIMGASLPSLARPPLREVIQFSDQAELEDCGVSIAWQIEGEEVMAMFTRGVDQLAYFQLHAEGSQSFTNLATDKRMTIDFSFRDKDQKVVDNGDGTLTISVLGTVNTTLNDNDGKVVRRVAGSAQFQVLVDHNGTPQDPFDDEFITDLGFVREHSGLDQFVGADFCDDLLSLTG